MQNFFMQTKKTLVRLKPMEIRLEVNIGCHAVHFIKCNRIIFSFTLRMEGILRESLVNRALNYTK